MTSLIANIVKASAVCTVIEGDALARLRELPSESVNCCVTSPPYWGLRDYKVEGQIGLEKTPDEYVARLVEVFREARRVLRGDGTLWLNMGDSYSTHPPTTTKVEHQQRIGPTGDEARRVALSRTRSEKLGGLPEKNLLGIPWRVAFALQADGWYLRQDIIWHKPNPMPESVTDRCTKAHEYVFLMAKRERYYYDAEAMQEPVTYAESKRGKQRPSQDALYDITGDHGSGRYRCNLNDIAPRETRNKRSVWTIPTCAYPEAHFATFPPNLIRPCVLAGCPVGGTVLDPFSGSGTTGQVALEEGRNALLIELNPAYIALIRKRCHL